MSDSNPKKNINNPIDLEKLFYEQNIDLEGATGITY